MRYFSLRRSIWKQNRVGQLNGGVFTVYGLDQGKENSFALHIRANTALDAILKLGDDVAFCSGLNVYPGALPLDIRVQKL